MDATIYAERLTNQLESEEETHEELDGESGETPEHEPAVERSTELPPHGETTKEVSQEKYAEVEDVAPNYKTVVIERHGGDESLWESTYKESGDLVDLETNQLINKEGKSLTQEIESSNENMSAEKIAEHYRMLDHFRNNPDTPYVLPDWIQNTENGKVINTTVAFVINKGEPGNRFIEIGYETFSHTVEEEPIERDGELGEEITPEDWDTLPNLPIDGELPEPVVDTDNLEINLNERFMDGFAVTGSAMAAENKAVAPEVIGVEPVEEFVAPPFVNDAAAAPVSGEVFIGAEANIEEPQPESTGDQATKNEITAEITTVSSEDESEPPVKTMAPDRIENRKQEDEVIDPAPGEIVVMTQEEITAPKEEIKIDIPEAVAPENTPGMEIIHEPTTVEAVAVNKPQEKETTIELDEVSPITREQEVALPTMTIAETTAETAVAMKTTVHEREIAASESVVEIDAQHEATSIKLNEKILDGENFVITKDEVVAEINPNHDTVHEEDEATKLEIAITAPVQEESSIIREAEMSEKKSDAETKIQTPQEIKTEVAPEVPRETIVVAKPVPREDENPSNITSSTNATKEAEHKVISVTERDVRHEEDNEAVPADTGEIDFEMDIEKPAQEKDPEYIYVPQRMTGREILLRSLGITPRRGNVFEAVTSFRSSAFNGAATQNTANQHSAPQRQRATAASLNGITLHRAA